MHESNSYVNYYGLHQKAIQTEDAALLRSSSAILTKFCTWTTNIYWSTAVPPRQKTKLFSAIRRFVSKKTAGRYA